MSAEADPDDPGDRPRRLALAVVAAIAVVVAFVQLAGGGLDASGAAGSEPAAADVADGADGADGAAQPPKGPEPEPALTPEPAPEPDEVVPPPTAGLPEGVTCWTRTGGEWQGDACAAWVATSETGPITRLASLWRRVIAADEHGITGFDAANGATLWRWDRQAAPVELLAAGHLLVTVDTDDRLVALDATFGVPMWEAEVPGWQAIEVRDDVVAVRDPTSLTLYETDDGAVRWSVDLPAAGGDATPLLADGLVVVSVDGRPHHGDGRHHGMRAYALDTADEIWRASFAPSQPMQHWPGDDLFVLAEDDLVAGVDLATGTPVWTRPLTSQRQMVGLDAMSVALLRLSSVDIVERATGTEIASLEGPALRTVTPAMPGTLLVDAVGGVQHLDIERAGVGWRAGVEWQARAPNLHEPSFVLTQGVPGGNHVVLAVGDGTTLLAFESFDAAPPPVALPPGCESARLSWAMGDHHDAWRGDRVHLRLDGRELWLGIDDAEHTTTFTVSARRHDDAGVATFGRFDGNLQARLEVDDGGRLAARYPAHWVVEADFDQPGCWKVHLAGDGLDETVLLPVATASPR